MDYETRARIRILPAVVLLVLLFAVVCIDIVRLRRDLAAK